MAEVGLESQPQPLHPAINCEASPLFHFLLLKRYAIANNPVIANITSNPRISFFSDAGFSVTVAVGECYNLSSSFNRILMSSRSSLLLIDVIFSETSSFLNLLSESSKMFLNVSSCVCICNSSITCESAYNFKYRNSLCGNCGCLDNGGIRFCISDSVKP